MDSTYIYVSAIVLLLIIVVILLNKSGPSRPSSCPQCPSWSPCPTGPANMTIDPGTSKLVGETNVTCGSSNLKTLGTSGQPYVIGNWQLTTGRTNASANTMTDPVYLPGGYSVNASCRQAGLCILGQGDC